MGEYCHPVTETFGLGQVMGRQEDGAPAGAQALNQLVYLTRRCRIQAGRRFVKIYDLRLVQERAGQGEALAHALAEATYLVLAAVA